jgi:hypothetical protein
VPNEKPGRGRVAHAEAFVLVAEDGVEIKGCGVATIARFTGGPGPSGRTEAAIAAPGRPPIRAVLAGRASWHRPGAGVPPEGRDEFLVHGVSREEVPAGALVTLVPAAGR